MSTYDVAIIGGGLAGLCAALALSESRSVVVVDSGDAQAGSRVAAGLVNPMPARRATLAWRADEALDSLDSLLETVHAAELPSRMGIIRPAMNTEQGADFRAAALSQPKHGTWYSPGEADEAYPHVKAPYGALFVRSGLTIELEALCRALRASAASRGVEYITDRVTGIREAPGTVEVRSAASCIDAMYAILACGASYGAFELLDHLRLHRVKGVVLETPPPSSLPPDSPSVAGQGYIANIGDHLALGTTFTHPPFEPRVLPEETSEIVQRCKSLLKDHHFERVVPRWGVRVTRHGSRRPVVTPVSRSGKIWFFGALGAKGLLTAPMLAAQLPGWLGQPGAVWPDLRPDGVRHRA